MQFKMKFFPKMPKKRERKRKRWHARHSKTEILNLIHELSIKRFYDYVNVEYVYVKIKLSLCLSC